VLHRDLKPANVMVGAFGEVQVMDWGLAKVLPRGGVDGEQGQERDRRDTVSLIRTQHSQGAATKEGSGSRTQSGDVLGTPAYMAPEQARGDVDLVDERADVFGLGALLCEILTGQPPFTGKTAEAHGKARTGQLDDAHARLDGCGADLVALAKGCLAAEPGQRPRQAGEVAAAVTAYQHAVAERLHQAELAGAEARARTEEERKTRAEAEARLAAERRARRRTVQLAAALLLGTAGLGAGGLWLQQQGPTAWRSRPAAPPRLSATAGPLCTRRRPTRSRPGACTTTRRAGRRRWRRPGPRPSGPRACCAPVWPPRSSKRRLAPC
jgi:serine/threonine-protein kinase